MDAITAEEITALENAYREHRAEYHSAVSVEEQNSAAWWASEVFAAAAKIGVHLDATRLDAEALDAVLGEDDGYDF